MTKSKALEARQYAEFRDFTKRIQKELNREPVMFEVWKEAESKQLKLLESFATAAKELKELILSGSPSCTKKELPGCVCTNCVIARLDELVI